MEWIMTKISLAVVSAALAIGMVAPASAGVNDPEILIYRFPGVVDNAGSGTSFSCTFFSGVAENIRFVTRSSDGTLLNNISIPNQAHLKTLTVGTDFVLSTGGGNLNTGFVLSGTTAIAATSTNIICTAMILDELNSKVVGVALRGIRFNPAPGSQE